MRWRLSVCLLVGVAGCVRAEYERPAPARWRSVEERVRAGFPGVEQLETNAVRALVDAGDVEIIDVRAVEEFEVSHIPGARNVPSDSSDAELTATIPRDRPVVVYCSVGWRSADITQRLIALGYQNVRNYLGSIFEWANRGLPLARDGGEASVVHPYSREWAELLRPELRAAR